MSVMPPSFGKLVRTAEQVLKVEVEQLNCKKELSPSGHSVIHTYAVCKVLEVIKGSAGSMIELRFLGGIVGTESLSVSDMPVMEAGAVYIVFVNENGRAFCPLAYVNYGSYKVVKDPVTQVESIARHNGQMLSSSQESRRLMAESASSISVVNIPSMSPSEFSEQIRKELKTGGNGNAR